MRFTKMHGAGNDYVYLDGFADKVPADPIEFSKRVSDRHFGIGGDGLILILPPSDHNNHARMRMFNADGSEGEMCGNAIRCVGKLLYDRKHVKTTTLNIETGRGVLKIELEVEAGKAKRARVNMQPPILEAEKIPTLLKGNPPIEIPIKIGDDVLAGTCVSMGNPHVVFFVPKITDDHVLRLGPIIETMPIFPNRINVEFAELISPTHLKMRVWERGSGETFACGTGASAVCVAGVLTGRTARKVQIDLRGGSLDLEWSEQDNCVYMTGPASEVFTGELANDFLS